MSTDPSLFDIFMGGAPPAITGTEATKTALDAVKEIAAAEKPIIDAAVQKVPDADPKDKKAKDPKDKKPRVPKDKKPKTEDLKDTKDKKVEDLKDKKIPIKKTKHDKTAKAAKVVAAPPPPPPPVQSEARHCPGYSMLRVERDKIERSRVALARKNENRAAQGLFRYTTYF